MGILTINEINTQYYGNGNVSRVIYHNGKKNYTDHTGFNFNLHREDGPAITEYYENGKKKKEQYYINGFLKNNNSGPTVIEYYENGNVKYIGYGDDGCVHNENGPAIIEYNEDGSLKYEEYYYKSCIRHPKENITEKTIQRTRTLKGLSNLIFSLEVTKHKYSIIDYNQLKYLIKTKSKPMINESVFKDIKTYNDLFNFGILLKHFGSEFNNIDELNRLFTIRHSEISLRII